MNDVVELFGLPVVGASTADLVASVTAQVCPFTDRKCFKVRKSQPEISIGSCTVSYGRSGAPILICPNRLLERRQVFLDCLHLLTLHEPGNELHVIPEIAIPGGSVDYFVASTRGGRVQDFVGVELQTLDTTGTVWPARQRALTRLGVQVNPADLASGKSFGMNWKMTAKTTLVQLHHKIATFEHISKHLVLIIQDQFLDYLKREFRFGHVGEARLGDPMHFHAYTLSSSQQAALRLQLSERLSTDTNGIAESLGLQAEARLEAEGIIRQIEAKISPATLITL